MAFRPVGRAALWDWLVGPEGRQAWSGDAEGFEAEPGCRYVAADGTTGEVRGVRPPARLRLTWQPTGRGEPTALQLTRACPRNDATRTTLRSPRARLADADEREAMRERWRAALDRIESSGP